MDRRRWDAILNQARDGDLQALGELLQSFRPYLRVIAHALSQQWHQAIIDDSDLIQETLLEAQNSFATFRGETEHQTRAWLRTIAVRTAGRMLRGLPPDAVRQAEELADQLIDSASSPSEQVLRQERALRLAAALAQLPDDMQAVLTGRHIRRQSHSEIAKEMQRSPAAVRQLYVRALRQLRWLLGEEN